METASRRLYSRLLSLVPFFCILLLALLRCATRREHSSDQAGFLKFSWTWLLVVLKVSSAALTRSSPKCSRSIVEDSGCRGGVSMTFSSHLCQRDLWMIHLLLFIWTWISGPMVSVTDIGRWSLAVSGRVRIVMLLRIFAEVRHRSRVDVFPVELFV